MAQVQRTELREAWQERVATFRASGQPVSTWCADNGVKEHQLRYWLSKFGAEPAQTEAQFIPVHLQDSYPLAIHIGPFVVEVTPGYNPDLLRNVLRTLISIC